MTDFFSLSFHVETKIVSAMLILSMLCCIQSFNVLKMMSMPCCKHYLKVSTPGGGHLGKIGYGDVPLVRVPFSAAENL